MKILISQAKQLKGGTNTHLAIEEIIRVHEGQSANPKFAILITDGLSAYPNFTLLKAQEAANKGITMISVGIRGSKYTAAEWATMENELLRIANNNPAHKFIVTDFSQMVGILPALNQLICTRMYKKIYEV